MSVERKRVFYGATHSCSLCDQQDVGGGSWGPKRTNVQPHTACTAWEGTLTHSQVSAEHLPALGHALYGYWTRGQEGFLGEISSELSLDTCEEATDT